MVSAFFVSGIVANLYVVGLDTMPDAHVRYSIFATNGTIAWAAFCPGFIALKWTWMRHAIPLSTAVAALVMIVANADYNRSARVADMLQLSDCLVRAADRVGLKYGLASYSDANRFTVLSGHRIELTQVDVLAAASATMLLALAVVTAFPVHVFSPGAGGFAAATQKGILVGVCLVILVALVVDYRGAYYSYRAIGRQAEARQKRIMQAHQQDEAPRLTLKPLYFSASLHTGNGEINAVRLFARDITGDPRHWLNNCYSNAHGLERVILEP